MGALTSLKTSPAKWIAEDDLLLKNAVEAGASLASLAKGAVPFSRRFTIHELEDRWRSLLYDPDISAEASARIVEIEFDLASSNLTKSNKTCNSKEKETSSGKRKLDSICSHYYAMRKRILSEPLSSNLGFLVPPVLIRNSAYDRRTQCKQSINNFSLDYSYQEAGYDSRENVFPDLMKVDSSAINAETVGLVEGKVSDGRAGKSCLLGYSEKGSSLPLEARCNNGTQPFEDNFNEKHFPDILRDNLISVDTSSSSDVHQIRQTNALGAGCSIGNGDNDIDHDRNHCSDFVRINNLISHVPDCDSSLCYLEYSSPSSSMPIWRTMEDTPTIPTDEHYLDKDQELLKLDDEKKVDASGCNISAPSEPKLDDSMCAVGPTIMSEDEFMDFSDTYMDFAHDNEFFQDVEENGISDTSHPCNLNTTILSSPSNNHPHIVGDSNDLGPTNILEMDLEIQHDQMLSCLHDYHIDTFSGVNIPSASSQATNSTKSQEEFMYCALNTEDSEIPNNDHVMFPDQSHPPFSTILEQCMKENTGLVSAMPVSRNERAPVGDLYKVKEDTSIKEPIVSSVEAGSTSLPKMGCAENVESSERSVVEVPTDAGIGVEQPNLSCVEQPNWSTPVTVALNSITVDVLKEESLPASLKKHNDPDTSFASFLEDHLQETDNTETYTQNATDSYPEEVKMQSAVQACLPLHPDPVSAEMGLLVTVSVVSTSVQEKQHSDVEDSIPHFSDIEALVLDMDLGPYDEESCLVTQEASRYQRMDTKNTIRWEQSFRSYMNRSILSHGAFAVFYGRHLKYFIKDPEVSLGRETEEIKVDIDLGREGRSNRISRRQAIIKMDKEGVFFLYNLGKFPIFVSGKEVPAKKRTNLLSSSLVEIQGMHFMFDVSESAVRRYILNRQQEHRARFEWKPDQNL